jgi:L-ribulose-5-phosphate 3-epimerase
MHRRTLLKAGAAAACLATDPMATMAEEGRAFLVPLSDRICLFTDHLDDHGFSYAEVAKQFAQLKIAGPDLTVRGGGLVLPERVAEDLPKAAAAMKDQGLSIPMISTNLTSAKDPTAKPILDTMGKLGIRYYKLGYYHYHNLAKWESDLETERKQLAGLLEFGRGAGLHAGLHNHSGAAIGGAVWDALEFLKPLDPVAAGIYFDPGHATIEGPKHAWKLNLERVSSRVTMVALKDFVWEKTSRGWQTRWCPLGEGMVNWDDVFPRLAKIPFPGPISIHIEYDPGGSTRVQRLDNSLTAAERDVAFVRKHLANVGMTN